MSSDPEMGFNLPQSSFEHGNQLWRLGLQRNRDTTPYPTPESLINKCAGYFEWLDNNPLQEARLVSFEGNSRIVNVPKMRSPTLAGLCLHLEISRDNWGKWRRGENRSDLQPVVEIVEQIMYEAKFTGAAAGLLNPLIISRDLGLADRSEVTGRDGGPLQTVDLTDETRLIDEARRLNIPLSAFGIGDSTEEGV